MSCAAGAAAQTAGAAAKPAADTTMLTEQVEGDYLVRRYLIRSTDDVDYSIRYRISVATLNAALGGNTQALSELNSFVEGMMQDTSRRVCEVIITGYASPDGSVAYNRELAARRANDFKAYVDSKYHFSKHYNVTVNSEAEDWAMTRDAIAASSIPDRAAVLAIVDGTLPPMQKEQALKRMPAAWSYLAAQILPPMRRVEVMIGYATERVVEQRTLIPRPAPQPAPAPDYVVVEEDVSGVLVEMPDEGAVRKEMREERHSVKKEAKAAQRLAKRDARKAAKIARAEEKAARKIAKKEAKAAKKAVRAAAKTSRDLEKM